MSAPCPRAWEVDALADGRLGDDERRAFERHCEQCASCRATFDGNTRVRARIRELELSAPTPLDRRRLRARVLEEANRRILAPPARSKRGVVVAVTMAAIAAVVVFAAARPRRPSRASNAIGPAASAVAPTAPHYAVEGLRDAHWRVLDAGAVTRIALDDGRARFTVEHLDKAQRFVVVVADGEVEVRGTSFVVDVIAGRTRAIVVESGVVAASIGGESRTLPAGASWSRDLVVASSTAAPLVGVASAPPPGTSPAPFASVAPSTHPPALPGPRFVEAMSAFSSGDFAGADASFARFAADFPSDARTEDALYLRAVAHQRMGDRDGATNLAHAYLARYPNGFHAKEAEEMVGP